MNHEVQPGGDRRSLWKTSHSTSLAVVAAARYRHLPAGGHKTVFWATSSGALPTPPRLVFHTRLASSGDAQLPLTPRVVAGEPCTIDNFGRRIPTTTEFR